MPNKVKLSSANYGQNGTLFKSSNLFLTFITKNQALLGTHTDSTHSHLGLVDHFE